MKIKYLTTGQLASKMDVTTTTIRRWIAEGKFEHVKKTLGDRSNFLIGVPYETFIIYYARVSHSNQSKLLTTQLKTIKKGCKYGNYEEISDIGSGFDFERKGFKSLLDRAIKGEILNIVVSDQDRLTKGGFEFIEWIITRSGGSITCINESIDKQETNYDELISTILAFCNSYYGERTDYNKENKDLSKE